MVAKALMALGREIELVQRHKAEEDLAVAAASILARDGFVKGLAKLEKQFERGTAERRFERRWTRRRRNLWTEQRRGRICRKSPRCISARRCARKVCPSRRRRNGGNVRSGICVYFWKHASHLPRLANKHVLDQLRGTPTLAEESTAAKRLSAIPV